MGGDGIAPSPPPAPGPSHVAFPGDGQCQCPAPPLGESPSPRRPPCPPFPMPTSHSPGLLCLPLSFLPVGFLPTHSLSVSLSCCLACPATCDIKLGQSSDVAGGDCPPRTSLSSRAGMFSKSVTLRWTQQSLRLSTPSLEVDGLGSDCSLPPMWTDWSHDLGKPRPCLTSQFHHLEKGTWALPCVM